ncbi:MAG: hypothetical protein L6Q40_05600 [Azonexus sp.]|nr:hypothetical protein [Azonexus sp.]
MKSSRFAHRLGSLSLLIACLQPVAGQAQSSGDVARLNQELSTIQQERLRVQTALEDYKKTQLDAAIQNARINGKNYQPPAPERSEEQLKAEIRQALDVKTALSELGDVSQRQRDKVRGAFLQLRTYGEQFRKIDQVNRIKTVLSLGMNIAQEVQAFATTAGKPIEIATWVADKLSGELMKRTLDGSGEYYKRTIVGISGAAASVTPEMERLAQLSSLSLEGWRAYLNKYEDKDLETSGGQIMAKGRVLLDHITRAEDSMIKLHRTLDTAARESQIEIQRTNEGLENLNRALAELTEKKTDQPIKKTDDRLADLQAQLARLDQREREVNAKLTQAMQNFGAIQRAEAMASTYFSLRQSFANDHSRFQDHIDQTLTQLDRSLSLADEAATQEKQWQKEFLEHFERRNGTPTYPSDQVNDETAIANTRQLDEETLAIYRRQNEARKTTLEKLKTAQAEIITAWKTPPYDPANYDARLDAVEAAFHRARTLLDQEMSSNTAARDRLLSLFKSLIATHEAGLPPNPFSKPINFDGGLEFKGHDAPQPLIYQGIAVVQNFIYAREQDHASTARYLAYDEASLPGRIEHAQKSSADARREFLRNAAQCQEQGQWMLEGMQTYLDTMTRYHSALSDLVTQGVLLREASGPGRHYRINQAWIKDTLGSEPADCRGVARIMKAIGSEEAKISQLRLAAEGATRRAQFGVLTCPANRWSELNQASIHGDMIRLMNAIRNALDESESRFAQLPPGDPISKLVERLPNDNLTLVHGFPSIYSGMQRSVREIDAHLKIAREELIRAAKMERADATWLAGIKRYPETIRANIQEQLGCLAPDHVFIAGFDERLDELKKLATALSHVAGYQNASELIKELTAILDGARNLGVSQEAAYFSAVKSLISRHETAHGHLNRDKAHYSPVDVDQANQILYDIDVALAAHRNELQRQQSMPSSEQIQTLYQQFIDAYANGNLQGLLRLLAPSWTGGDGSDIRDVEDYLTNAFKMFERIQYRISSFSMSPRENGRVQISYSVTIIGENHRQNLKHEETSKVIEEIGLQEGKPVILRTLSGKQWLN